MKWGKSNQLFGPYIEKKKTILPENSVNPSNILNDDSLKTTYTTAGDRGKAFTMVHIDHELV